MIVLAECRREISWKISVILFVYFAKIDIYSLIFLWQISGYSTLNQSQPSRIPSSYVQLSSSVLSFVLLTPSPIRELPSVCAGNLRSRGAGVVHCQGLHRGKVPHHPREDFLHLRLWSVHPTVLQRQVWNARFTTHRCDQAWATSCKTGNGTEVRVH